LKPFQFSLIILYWNCGVHFRISSKYGLETSPKLVDIIAAVPSDHRKALVPKLKAKPVRTASGVSTFFGLLQNFSWLYILSKRKFQIAVVAVMCKPHRCPHINMTGNICVYCPGGPDSDFEYSTQSYTGYEPTSMRAIRARYDPFLQTKHRVDQVNVWSINAFSKGFITNFYLLSLA